MKLSLWSERLFCLLHILVYQQAHMQADRNWMPSCAFFVAWNMQSVRLGCTLSINYLSHCATPLII